MSRALQGPETNYPILEKLVPKLIYTVRCLRCYFPVLKIKVLTSHLINQVLLRPKKSGRLAKWTIQMGEHDIEYRLRTSIKAQALADFLVEIPDTFRGIPKALLADPLKPEARKDVCELHIDRAASKEGSGTSLILKNLRG